MNFFHELTKAMDLKFPEDWLLLIAAGAAIGFGLWVSN